MLDVFITSRVRRKIVVVYAKFPDFKSHIRGLAKLVQEDAGNVCRELSKLEKIGFLTTTKQGNTKIYTANRHFVAFRELQSLVLKFQNQPSRPPKVVASKAQPHNQPPAPQQIPVVVQRTTTPHRSIGSLAIRRPQILVRSRTPTRPQ